LAVTAIAAAGLAVAVWLPSRDDVASAGVQRPGLASFGTGVFADEFNRGAGGVDPSKWSLSGSGYGGARVDGGDLVLNQAMSSRQSFTGRFGHAEARIKASGAAELWRVFTLVDGQSGWFLQGRFEPLGGGVDPTSGDGFHTYEIDWSPETVTWTVDGKPSLRLVRSMPGRPVTLVLNLGSGGRYASRLEVDYVRVTTSDDAPPAAEPTPTESPSESPSPTPTESPSESPSPTPSESPSESPSPTPSESPSATPSETPSATPTSAAPTAKPWAAYTDYQPGDLVTYRGVTYKVLEAHTSLPGWEPPKVPSLFAKV
jgi:hypothetical protein